MGCGYVGEIHLYPQLSFPVSGFQSGGKPRVREPLGRMNAKVANPYYPQSEPWAKRKQRKMHLGFEPRSAAPHGNWQKKEQLFSGGKHSQFRPIGLPMTTIIKRDHTFNKASYFT